MGISLTDLINMPNLMENYEKMFSQDPDEPPILERFSPTSFSESSRNQESQNGSSQDQTPKKIVQNTINLKRTLEETVNELMETAVRRQTEMARKLISKIPSGLFCLPASPANNISNIIENGFSADVVAPPDPEQPKIIRKLIEIPQEENFRMLPVVPQIPSANARLNPIVQNNPQIFDQWIGDLGLNQMTLLSRGIQIPQNPHVFPYNLGNCGKPNWLYRHNQKKQPVQKKKKPEKDQSLTKICWPTPCPQCGEILRGMANFEAHVDRHARETLPGCP